MHGARCALGCLAAFLAAAAFLAPAAEAGVATASFDLGSEWIKIALVKPGVPMDIVLNKESKRKTASVVALRDNELLFAGPASTTAVKYPAKAFRYLVPLLGQQLDSPLVKRYQGFFPEHTLEADPSRGTVVFRMADNSTYSVEELVALILQNCRTLAEATAEQPISGVVLVVPPFWSQAERKALLLAAKMADINVLQLINSNVGVAINYGVFRRKDFNATEKNLMFYDMGSTATIASIVGYSTVTEKGKKTEVPQLKVKSVGYDRTLGGQEWDMRVRDHLLGIFKENKKVKGDPSTNARTMAKLLKEAQKVKTVLSANTQTRAQIEGLYQEIDFRNEISRETLNEITADLLARVQKPIQDALEGASMTIADIDELIIVGGGSRVPAVQEKLLAMNDDRELGKKLNGDEAATLGASYQAAVHSKAFRVAKFIVKDAHLFPVQVRFEREVENEDGTTITKNVTRTIYHRFNELPQKKVLSFNKASGDTINFDVFFGDISFLSDAEQSMFGERNISSVRVSGVTEKLGKYKEEEFTKVKAHFRLDDSGIVSVERAEAIFEVKPEPVAEEESTLSKLGNMLFGKDKDGNATEGEGEGEGEPEADKKADDKTAEDDKATDSDKPAAEAEDEKKKKEEPASTDDNATATPDADAANATDADANATETDANVTDTNATDANATDANATETAKKAPKPKTVKEALAVDVDMLYVATQTAEGLAASKDKLHTLREAERQRQENAAALNSLESFIYGTREALYKEDFETVSTEEQREEVRAACSTAADWLDEEGWDSNATIYRKKQAEVNKPFKPIADRVKELQERPAAINRVLYAFNLTHEFAMQVKNFTKHQAPNSTLWVSEKEMESLWTVFNETQEWLTKKWKLQNETALTEPVVLKVATLATKASKLERELVYLMKKPQPRPPKKKKKKAKKINLNNTVTINATNATLNSTNATFNGTVIEPLDETENVASEEDAAGAGDGKGEDPATPDAEEAPEASTTEKPKKKEHDSEEL